MGKKGKNLDKTAHLVNAKDLFEYTQSLNKAPEEDKAIKTVEEGTLETNADVNEVVEETEKPEESKGGAVTEFLKKMPVIHAKKKDEKKK